MSYNAGTGFIETAALSGVDAPAVVTAIRREILSMEPNATFLEAATMETVVDVTLLPARLAAQTIGGVDANDIPARGASKVDPSVALRME